MACRYLIFWYHFMSYPTSAFMMPGRLMGADNGREDFALNACLACMLCTAAVFCAGYLMGKLIYTNSCLCCRSWESCSNDATKPGEPPRWLLDLIFIWSPETDSHSSNRTPHLQCVSFLPTEKPGGSGISFSETCYYLPVSLWFMLTWRILPNVSFCS